jgi:hypothetical protein
MDQNKPETDIFFSKCVEELKVLKENKFKLDSFVFDVRIQSFLMDLPAKAAVLNIKQFNGEFGCLACDHPGESRGPGVRYYPYTTKVNKPLILFKINYLLQNFSS